MLLNIIKQSFLNQKKAMILIVASVAIGTAIAASLLSLSMDISNKVARELRSFGANILVKPRVSGLAGIAGQERYLDEADIIKIKTIFWRHNILGIVPFLYVKDLEKDIAIAGTWYEKALKIPGEDEPFLTGVRRVMPWWQIKGRWPEKGNEILIGISYAQMHGLTQGDRIRLLNRDFTITGLLNTGSSEDEMVVGELSTIQALSGLDGRISRVLVSALTTPMDDFAYKDPKKMTKTEYEKWYCTGYVTSIARQIEEVMKGSLATPIWSVAETEGKVLRRLRVLIYMLTILALAGSALGVSSTMIMSLLRRTHEVALMKAIGADRRKTITIFFSEAFILGITGGAVGYIISLLLAGYIGHRVFGTGLEQRMMLLPISMVSSVLIAVFGSYLPIRKALRIRPAIVLKGE
jgi:putative ABC transport system permease protein